jgi:hypothetical protein
MCLPECRFIRLVPVVDLEGIVVIEVFVDPAIGLPVVRV